MSDTSHDEFAAPFLADVADDVSEQLQTSTTVREFLDGTSNTLSLDDRRRLVDQAMVLVEDNYVHLRLKAAMHGIDPVQRLRLLQARLRRANGDDLGPEHRFHAELAEIFHSLRDLHTNYLLPAPYSGQVAYLPFLVEEYFDDDGTAHYIVSHVVEGFDEPGFEPGVELTHWSGIPIARAVELNADRYAGSNAAARHSRGLESLTIRPLSMHLPPYEQWVTVRFVGLDGTPGTLEHDWLVVANLPSFLGDADAISVMSTSLGLDLDGDETSRAKTLLFAPRVARAAEEATDDQAGPTEATDGLRTRSAAEQAAPEPAEVGADVPTSMPGVFRARPVATASGVFGHLRIFTFSVQDPVAFVDEFVRLLDQLPREGLVLDVRSNGGGHIFASEFALQTLTPHRITPEPVQFSSTALNLAICRAHADNPTGQIDLGPWFESLDQASQLGAPYSRAFPITPPEGANAIGQRYHGPVVLVTDARCYSATDIFAAGFADHDIGTILGVDDNTGAGGANVWTHGLLKVLLEVVPGQDSPYEELPGGANMRVSIRRTLRVGEMSGTPVEDLGVVPDVRHHLTRDDVLSGNVDLLDRAGELLAAMPLRRLEVSVDHGDDGTLELDLDTAGIDRVDIHVDDRPRASVDVGDDGHVLATVIDVPDDTTIRLEGHEAGTLVAARTFTTST